MRLALGFPFLMHLADTLHHFQRGVASPCGVARFFEGRTPEGHDGVAAVLVEGAMVIKNEAGHVREILIEKERQVLGVELFGNGREAAGVAEHYGNGGSSRVTWLTRSQRPREHLA